MTSVPKHVVFAKSTSHRTIQHPSSDTFDSSTNVPMTNPKKEKITILTFWNKCSQTFGTKQFKLVRYVSDEMKEVHQKLKLFHPTVELIENCFRGIGQIVFLNNPITGFFLLLGLAVYSWFAAICAFVGVLSSTLFAAYLQIDHELIEQGLYGYNGALVGAVIGIFSKSPFHEDGSKNIVGMVFSQILFTIVLSSYCPFITRFWGKLMNSLGSPGLTMGYNIVSAAFLLATYSFGYTSPDPDILNPHLNPPRKIDINGTVVETEFLTMIAPDYNEDQIMFRNLYEAWFRSIGQIYFADSALSGILILIGVFIASRRIGWACVAGTTASILTAVAVGVDGVAIYHGLWGYNGALGAMVVLTFCALNFHSLFICICCAIASTLALGLFRGMFAPWGIPSLTFPYNVVAVTILAMRSQTDPKARLRDISLEPKVSSIEGPIDVELPEIEKSEERSHDLSEDSKDESENSFQDAF